MKELPLRTTAANAPGPGPIRTSMWAPIAKKWLSYRRVICHSDSARAFKLKLPGVLNDYVTHCNKKINGKWMKPVYAMRWWHKLPGGKKVHVVKGTQYIDGFWRILRQRVGATTTADRHRMRVLVRVAQWRHWHMGDDLWAEACKSFQRHWNDKR